MRYDYECPKCKGREERRIPVERVSDQYCVYCGSRLRRLITTETAPQIMIPMRFKYTEEDTHMLSPEKRPPRTD